MKRFLSLDWDYFIAASTDYRRRYFLDTGVDLSQYLSNFLWSIKYKEQPELRKVQCRRKHLRQVEDCLMYRFCGPAMVTESHAEAYDFILSLTSPRTKFEVINIDYHHDVFGSATDEYINCGNWVLKLKQARPRMIYRWVGQADVKSMCPNSIMKLMHDWSTVEALLNEDHAFDGVFLCRSDCWSPPHLDKRFDELAMSLLLGSYNPSETYQNIPAPRKLQDINIEIPIPYVMR